MALRLLLLLVLCTSMTHAEIVHYKVDAPFIDTSLSVKLNQHKDEISVDVPFVMKAKDGKYVTKNNTLSFVKDPVNVPFYWNKHIFSVTPDSIFSYCFMQQQKLILILVGFDSLQNVVVNYFTQIDTQNFKLSVIVDPFMSASLVPESTISRFFGTYVGKAETEIEGVKQDQAQRDIDFSLKNYRRGFNLGRSLIICPEGREVCMDGKRKAYKYYFKKLSGAFYVEEEKVNFFKETAPPKFQDVGSAHWAVFTRGVLRTYRISFTPEIPFIFEGSSSQFEDKKGKYDYLKYHLDKLRIKVSGDFFKTKVDQEYVPQIRQ